MNLEQQNRILSGIELIAKEREEQIVKHNRTIESDVECNSGDYEIDGNPAYSPQLTHTASQLIAPDGDLVREYIDIDTLIPHNWNKALWRRMMKKPYKERLIIAGALIAAEIDRLTYLEQNKADES